MNFEVNYENKVLRELLFTLFQTASDTLTVKYIGLGFHSEDHGVGLHNLTLVSEIPKGVIFDPGVNVGYERQVWGEDHEVTFILGKKRRKFTARIKHGNEPIPLSYSGKLDHILNFQANLLYGFPPLQFNVVCFEVHINHFSLRLEGLENFTTPFFERLIRKIQSCGSFTIH